MVILKVGHALAKVIAIKHQEVSTFASVGFMVVMDIKVISIKAENEIMEIGVSVIHGIVSLRKALGKVEI